jgi:sigma-54 dependent transcriptional regulator, acetoin dehydrogenase operon transcriptional activator AcoR
MTATALIARTSPRQLREALRRLLNAGETSELLDPSLQASWQRSRRFGLEPDGKTLGAPHASGAQLARALEHRRELVSQARPVMELLCEQIRESDSMVILADAQGMLLQSLGDTEFADKAARVALRPGAIWHEQWRGTNAIGTALAEGAPVVVRGAEHYLERNCFLTCAAAPITDPAGLLLGVLDISGDRRGYHPHTLGLVRSAARMIEHQLFLARHGAGLLLRLHGQAEGIGTVAEGLFALSEGGWIIGANATALAMLGLQRTEIGATTVERALGVEWHALLCRGAKTGRMPRQVRRPNGTLVWVRLDMGRGVISASAMAGAGTSSSKSPADALAALDTGDGAMAAVIDRARRVIDKPIALLLQGESGVGKELFARACHHSGSRRNGPYVAVNCAALPDTLIEAELFGYRPGAYTGASRDGAPGRIREAEGGTLFLDEIGDMPLSMQARLLRVLQERQVVPLGGGKPVAVDFRLICATHRKLRDEVDAGRFREDLFYRVNGLAVQLPPLRERSDLGALIAAMLRDINRGCELELAPDLLAAFSRYRWPGNLRQLSNVLRTASALIGDDESVIDRSHLPDDVAEELQQQPSPRLVEDCDTDLRLHAGRCVQQAVRTSNGNMSEAARRLGISRNTLYRKLRESGLP